MVFANAAGAAAATTTYRGKTSQGFTTVVKVKDGVLRSVSVPWVGHCRDKRFKWGPVRPFRWVNDPADPIETKGKAFSDSGRSVTHSHGDRVVSSARLRGHFSASGDRVSGTQKASVHVRVNGVRDYCSARVRWSAKLVPGMT
jgi:hypothetical protein